MMAGDIVSVRGKEAEDPWVVADFHGAPGGEIDVRVVRATGGSARYPSAVMASAYVCRFADIEIVGECPVVTGQTVKVGNRQGEVLAFDEYFARVWFGPQPRQTKNNNLIWSDGWDENVPIWWLVLENMKPDATNEGSSN